MSRLPRVSIIIPLYVITDRFFIDLKKFKNLNYKNFEILIVCDKIVTIPASIKKFTRLVLTGLQRTGPAEKRDIGLTKVNGDICAFIDDDAYPHPDWIINALKEFKDSKVAAVGGPGGTPMEDSYWEKLSGLLYESIFCGGFFRHRFIPLRRRLVVDYPAYNLLVRTKVLKDVGGYGNSFYGGEDTFLCLKITNAGYQIVYSPDAIVYHHRRALFWEFLKQISNVGLHRGYFARKFPQTSRKIGYFLPTMASSCFIVLALLSCRDLATRSVFVPATIFAFLLGLVSVINKTNIFNASLVSVGIILTHIFYGSYFLKGFFTKNLNR